MIQSDPDTKTNASMFFSLSQRSRCRRGSDCSIDCSKSLTIWQIKEGATIYPKQTAVGELGPGMVVAGRFCCAQTGEPNPRRPIKASFPPSSGAYSTFTQFDCCAMADGSAWIQGFGRDAGYNKSQR